MAFVGRKPTNAPLTSDDIPNGIISAADLASGISGLITWQSVQTTGFTAVAGRGYPCNTTSAAFTVTLPASPSVGDQVAIVDYAGTFDTNALTINPNGNKIEGATSNLQLTGEREGATLTYIDSTQGWLASSGINEGTDALEPTTYTASYLIVAGGGGGGGANNTEGGGGGGAGGLLTGTTTFTPLSVYTITVGAGGVGVASNGNLGSNSSITGLTAAVGGGGGAKGTASSGGSGGGGGSATGSGTAGLGTVGQGNNGGAGTGGSPRAAGGGGGAGAVGTNGVTGQGGAGGNGIASSITGSSVTYAGGGGGATDTAIPAGAGGSGGGGAGSNSTTGTNGTANTGGGGGGSCGSGSVAGSSGGSGVVILSVPTARYSSITTGSPTVTTKNAGADTVLTFTGSGSYTA